MILILFLVASLAAAASFFLLKNERSLHTLSFVWSTIVASLAFAVAFPVLAGGPAFETGLIRVDAFAALLIALVGFVQWTAVLVPARVLPR